MSRPDDIQAFLDAALAAFLAHAADESSRDALLRIENALRVPGVIAPRQPEGLPVCNLLPEALAIEPPSGEVRQMLRCFAELTPDLSWRRRPQVNDTASANFDDGHAYTVIAGPGGLEHRAEVWIGATLMAPDVRYPDHSHPPEEVYLVLSPGEFRQEAGPWFRPGTGGSFYNPPGIRHAMRSGDAPLFAFWALWNPDGLRDSASKEASMFSGERCC